MAMIKSLPIQTSNVFQRWMDIKGSMIQKMATSGYIPSAIAKTVAQSRMDQATEILNGDLKNLPEKKYGFGIFSKYSNFSKYAAGMVCVTTAFALSDSVIGRLFFLGAGVVVGIGVQEIVLSGRDAFIFSGLYSNLLSEDQETRRQAATALKKSGTRYVDMAVKSLAQENSKEKNVTEIIALLR